MKQKKKYVIAIILLICSLIFIAPLFTSCSKKNNKNNEEPNSSIAGYYSSEQRYYGGNSKENKNVNVNGITISNNNDSTDIKIEFIKGSKASGIDTADIDSVPEYEIFCLESPNRFVVKLSSITFWDYEDSYEAVDSQGNVLGMFRPYTSTLNKDDTQDIYLFFQLNNNIAYQAKEDKGNLEITLKKEEKEVASSYWYVVSTLYYDWEKMIGNVDLFPTYTSDLTKHQLVSKPFASKDEAQKYLDDTKPKLEKLNVSDDLTIKEIATGTLPEYDANTDNKAFENNKLIKVDSKELTLPLLMPYARYLCSTPDGKQMLFSKDISFESDGEMKYYVELWMSEMSGKATKLNIGEFAPIDKAEFSPDGKKVALLNNTTDYSLEVYDFDTKEIINLGEEGIGNMVANFTWDENGNVMHVVSGDNGAFQLKTYDFSKSNGERINVLNDTPLEQNGGFQFSGGELYYCVQVTSEIGYEGTIYKVDNSTGKSSEVAKGVDFAISPDGKYMALKIITDYSQFNSNSEEEFGEGSKVYGIKLVEISTGKETLVKENSDISNIIWSYDSTKMYFTENKIIDRPNDQYFFELNSYVPVENKTTKIVDIKSDDIVTTKESNTLLVADFVNSSYATYVLDINNYK